MKFSHYAMGTTFEIFIAGQEESYAGSAAKAVFEEIDRLEGILSRFDPRSDVGQLIRLKPGQTLQVGIELTECLELADEVYRLTNGAFDVTVGSLTGNREEEKTKQTFFGANRGGLMLDFGGMGKGYALDKSLEILADWDIEHALLHGGTSTALAIGDSPGERGSAGKEAGEKGWPVGMAGERVFLRDMALSGSGKEVKGEHILDPKTGEPAAGHRSAWVVHPSAAMADALSTAFIVMQPEEVAEFCRNNPHIWVKVIEPSGPVCLRRPTF